MIYAGSKRRRGCFGFAWIIRHRDLAEAGLARRRPPAGRIAASPLPIPLFISLDLHLRVGFVAAQDADPRRRSLARPARGRARGTRPKPLELGACSVTGTPKLGASATLTLLGMTVSNTSSERCWRSSRSTSCASRVRSSCMVITTPVVISDGLRSRRTRSSVPRNSTRPSSARYSACTGIRTRSAAVRALIVTGPSAGGQSSRVRPKRSRTGPRRSRSRVSKCSIRGSSTDAPARSRLAGTIHRLSGPAGRAAAATDVSPTRQS